MEHMRVEFMVRQLVEVLKPTDCLAPWKNPWGSPQKKKHLQIDEA